MVIITYYTHFDNSNYCFMGELLIRLIFIILPANYFFNIRLVIRLSDHLHFGINWLRVNL